MKTQIIFLVLSYLRFFAKLSLARHKPTIIGIAGSVGKSSTANALYAILKDHFPTKSVGNSETGIPLGILGLTPNDYSWRDWLRLCLLAPLHVNNLRGTKYLIAEMGIDEPDPPKNMEYLLTILKPDISIVLNESATHSMQFDKTIPQYNPPPSGEGGGEGKMALSDTKRLKLVVANIAKEDMKIISRSGCKVGIYNADDTNITANLHRIRNATLLSFGKDKTNDISYGDYSVNLDCTSFTVYVNDQGSTKIVLTFSKMIIPQEYQEIFAASLLAAKETGLTFDQIRESLIKNFTLPKGRSSLLTGINGSVILDSSYNASKAATIAFLDLTYHLKRITKRPVVFLMGDMRELGKEAQTEHEEVAQKLIGIVDYLYLVGPLTREYVLPTYNLELSTYNLKEVRWFDTSVRAGEFLKDNLPKNAIVLVKGSQNTIFLEETIKYILADKKDISKLCRQSAFWMKKKK